MVSLEDFRGRRVLLVHWNPGCGFCVLIAPELAEFQGDLRDRNTELVLISNGDLEANRRLAQEHGLDCLILLQHDGGRLEAFQQLGTPVAYLLDEEGLVAAPLAIGAEQVPVLARKAVAGAKRLPGQRPLSQSRIEREGLKAGTPAPRFALPDVYGTPVTLEGLRGQRVLLVFSDPQCGPCATLVPELVRLHRAGRDNGLAVVMVGRGEVADNRRIVKEHGIDFPVVVQEKWRLSREYGIFATPVAFLIDQDGVIVRDVARGAEEIVGLARDAVTGPETEVSRNKMG